MTEEKNRCENCNKMIELRKYDVCFYSSRNREYQGKLLGIIGRKIIYECLKRKTEYANKGVGG